MSARSAVLTRCEDARPIRIQIGATTRTVTESQYAQLIALLDADAADVTRVSPLREARPLIAVPAAARRHAARSLWDVADAIVPGLIWIIGLLFAAGALPL